MPCLHSQQSVAGRYEISKWHTHARVGLYLGNSLRHAKTLSLVLHVYAGFVSPQYHVRFDDFFETVNTAEGNFQIKWQMKCHFSRRLHQVKNRIMASKEDTMAEQDTTLWQPSEHCESPPYIPSVSQLQEEEVCGLADVTPNAGTWLKLQPVRWSKCCQPLVGIMESIKQRGLVYLCIFDNVDGDEETILQLKF